MACPKLKKRLDELLMEPGIAGYSIVGNKIVVYVETEEAKATAMAAKIEGFEVEVKNIGRLEML
ncbi:MAG: hypothetical protein BA066_06170 [Candidatus Korarchaeota archaeon NZ13-K]|nr:MAG: hypothetical protein BA066_06170 [Candidatus Korarchaeota archaeon NZ13-K]